MPAWVALLCAGLAFMMGLLALVLDARAWSWSSAGLVAITIMAWLIEISGVRWPRWLFVGLTVLPAAWMIYAGHARSEFDTLVPFLPCLAVGWVAYVGTRREGLLTLAAATISISPSFLVASTNRENWLAWALALLISWLSTYAIATQRRLVHDLRAAQADLARQAAAEERRRIAREVHDVVAHSLAITMLHLTGARHILARDPHQASEALALAEQLGRQSLAEIRRTVGLLSADRPGSTAPPLPGIEEIAQLVTEFVRAGLHVRSHVSGDHARLSPGVSLDLYRIAQEALTNAAKHAPGAQIDLVLVIEERAAILRVHDNGGQGQAASAPATSLGLGIGGMRERAALTPRELEVLRLIGRGVTNQEIADLLVISEATVKSHIGNILGKPELRDRAAAIVFAFDYGLVQPAPSS